MKLNTFIPGLIVWLFFAAAGLAAAQTRLVQEGAVLSRAGGTRLAGVEVQNMRTRAMVASNGLGLFSISSLSGDTIELRALGYVQQRVVVTDFKDMVIRLQPNTQLEQVTVTERSLYKELEEVKQGYRKNGVFYGGKPPLLSYIFQPITALTETFGRKGRHARKFGNYAERELAYQEVGSRFSVYLIKNTVAISNEDLPVFRAEYMPTPEQISRWGEYDLMAYIVNSYKDFLSKKGKGDGVEGLKLPPGTK